MSYFVRIYKVNVVCRRGETTDAMGRLKLGPIDASGTGEGLCEGKHTNTHTRTRFT